MNRESFVQHCMEPATVALHGKVLIGSSGAVTSFTGRGIASVTKESAAGTYTVVLDDTFASFEGGHCSVLCATECVSKPQFTSQAVATKGTQTVVITCFDDDGNTGVANMTSGAYLMFTIYAKNTGV